MLVLSLSDSWTHWQWHLYKNIDKVGHFLAMVLFTMVALLALPRSSARSIIIGSCLVAAAIEIFQIFGARSADVLDLASSVAGTALVAFIYFSSWIRNEMGNDPG